MADVLSEEATRLTYSFASKDEIANLKDKLRTQTEDVEVLKKNLADLLATQRTDGVQVQVHQGKCEEAVQVSSAQKTTRVFVDGQVQVSQVDDKEYFEKMIEEVNNEDSSVEMYSRPQSPAHRDEEYSRQVQSELPNT
ncbi:hypothetical protein RB195_023942 [Necator americanus]|uniref:Uncharacterized protein n=1 Tax=Necator americanus TaxID=51031 RepID=A0ABR1EL80_NECAM